MNRKVVLRALGTDEALARRNDPGTANVVATIGQANMGSGDEQSHWVTLSAALEKELGKPSVR